MVFGLPHDLDSYEIIHKFGSNGDVGTTFEPISIGGIYRTPQPAAATALRVKAGSANDTAAGSGAREITLEGLDSTGAYVSEALATAGASASSNSSASFIRLYRAYVSASGTYATASAGSHSANIVIENSAGTEDWLTIQSTGFPRAQSEVGAYTVPLGKKAYVISYTIDVDSQKTADILFFKRGSILDASAPYEAMRLVFELTGLSGQETVQPKTPIGPFDELTDIGFMAKAAATAVVGVDFELILTDN